MLLIFFFFPDINWVLIFSGFVFPKPFQMNRLIYIHTHSVVAIRGFSVIPTMPINTQKLTLRQPPPITTSMLRTQPAWPVIWVKVTRITRSWCKVTTLSWGKKTILITSALIDFCLKPTPVEQGDTEQTSPTHDLFSLAFSSDVHVC